MVEDGGLEGIIFYWLDKKLFLPATIHLHIHVQFIKDQVYVARFCRYPEHIQRCLLLYNVCLQQLNTLKNGSYITTRVKKRELNP